MAENKISIEITADSSATEFAFSKAANAARSMSAGCDRAMTAAASATNKFANAAMGISPSMEKARSAIEKASTKVDSFTKKVENSAKRFDKSGQSWERIGTAAQVGVGIAAAAITAFMYKSVKASAQMEQTRIAFTTMLGSAGEANRFLSEMSDFAANTPFELPQVLDGSKRLLAMGFNAQQIPPVLTAIGDAAAGLGLQGDGINRLTLAIGQMAAKGKVSADEIRQLAEAGIPAWDMIAQKIGVSVPQAMKMAENGAISAADGIQGLVTGMNNKFGGMMENQCKSLMGMWSNVQDSLGITMTHIGDEIAKTFDLHDVLKNFKNDLEKFSGIVKTSGIKEAMREAVPDSLKVAILGIGSAMATVAAIAAGGFVKGLLVASGIALGTIGAIVAAVAGLTIAGYYLWENWEKVSGQLELVWLTMKTIAIGAIEGIVNNVLAMGRTIHNVMANILTLGQTKTKLGDGIKWDWSWTKGAHDELKAKEADIRMAQALAAERKESNDSLTGAKRKTIDPNNLGLKFGEGVGEQSKKGAKKASDQAITELNRINEKIVDIQNANKDMFRDFGQLKLDIVFEGLKGAEKVYAEIEREKDARFKAVDEWVDKHAKAVREAQALKESAEKNGNAKAIADATEALEQRIKLAKNAVDSAASYKKMIADQQKAKEIENATAINAIKAELDESYRQGDVDGYINALTEKNVAFMADMEAQQQIMDTYREIMLASQASTMQLVADMYSTTFSGLSTAFSGILTGVKSVSDAFKELGKSMLKVVADFVAKWLAAQLTNAIFGKGILTMTVAANKAAGKAIADAYREAAALVSLASWGANAIPAIAGITSTYAIVGATPDGGGGGGLGAGNDLAGTNSLGGMQGIGDWNFYNHQKRANGGYTSPGLTLVGERGPELVDFTKPGRVYTNNQLGQLINGGFDIGGMSTTLSKNLFRRLGLFSSDDGGSNTVINAPLNIYGNINNGSDAESLWDDWNDNLAGALRSG